MRLPRSNSVHVTGQMANASSSVKQDLETAIQTCKDLQQLAKAAGSNGGTVPNGVKVISALVLAHIASLDLVCVALAAMHTVLSGVPHAPALLRLEGGLKACASVLAAHSSAAKAVGPAMKLLARACLNSQMTAVVFLKEKGGAESLLRCVGAHLGDQAVVGPACDLLMGLSRHEKSARLLPAGEVACSLRDVLVGYLGRWDVCSACLRVLKNLAKCDETRLALLRSTECTKLLLGVSRILARLPERRKLFKRAYRTLWLLFLGLLPELPGPDLCADEEIFASSAQQPMSDEDMEYAVFPESQMWPRGGESEGAGRVAEAARVRVAAVASRLLPGAASCRTPRASDPAGAQLHSDGESLVARAMLHELERIMHPSRTINALVYDDALGPLVPLPNAAAPDVPNGCDAGAGGGSLDSADSSGAAANNSNSSSNQYSSTGASADDAGCSEIGLERSFSGGRSASRPPTHGRRAAPGAAPANPAPASVPTTAGGAFAAAAQVFPPQTQAAVAAQSTAAALEGRSSRVNASPSTSNLSRAARSGGLPPPPGSGGPGHNAEAASSAPLVFESRFESGNLRRAVRVYDREYDLHLAPDATDPEARCQWFYFSVLGASPGLPYKFNVVNLGKKDSLYNNGMRPLLCRIDPEAGPGELDRAEGEDVEAGVRASVRRGDWVLRGEDVCYYPTPYRTTPLKATTAAAGAGAGRRRSGVARAEGTAKRKGKGKNDDQVGKDCGNGLWGATFTLQLETSGIHYLAMCYPYSYTDLQHYMQAMLHGPACGESMREICRRSTLCRTIKGNRVDCLTITDFNTLAGTAAEAGAGVMLDRPYVTVSARVHPGETNASWMMKGVLDFLLSSNPLAARLRKTYVFKCIPMLNPDGVVNGNYRCSLAGCDLNRAWANPSRKRHPPIYFLKRMIDRIARSGRLVLFCDLHGHSRKEDVFVYGCEPFRGRDIDRDGVDPRDEAEARARVRLLPYLISKQNPAFVMRKCSFKVSKSKMGTGRVVVCRELGVPNSYTIEASFSGASCTGRHMTARDLEEMGQAFCRALGQATEAIEVSVEAEMELLHQVDEHCGLGLAAMNGKDIAGGENSGGSDVDSGEDEEEDEE